MTTDAYEDKVATQIQEVAARLEQFEATAAGPSAQAEIAVIKRLDSVKQGIDQKLQALKTTQGNRLAHARPDVDADLAAFKSSVDDLAARERK
jgi:hypothetical protein